MIKDFRLNYLAVLGFKSLADFKFRFGKFNCLIGLNGSGKSSCLQALDFASSISSDEMRTWLENRQLTVSDVSSRPSGGRNLLSFSIQFSYTENCKKLYFLWGIALGRSNLNLRKEKFSCYNVSERRYVDIFEYSLGKYSFYGGDQLSNHLEIFGSMLANLARQKDFNLISSEHIAAFKMLSEIKSFELLAPYLLRRSQKKDSSICDIGIGGEHLGVFVHNLTSEQRADLVDQVRKLYPNVTAIETKVRKFGWVELTVKENVSLVYNDAIFHVDQEHKAKVLNDGMLRVIAILAQKYSNHKTILFDEIENGVNAEVADKIVQALLSLDKQVIVTTHSPMLMNYIPEDVAKESVHLVYRRADGKTKETLFFDIPMVKDKLDFLAPGDAMLDVHLEDVAAEAEHIAKIKEEEEKAEKEKKKTENKPDQVK